MLDLPTLNNPSLNNTTNTMSNSNNNPLNNYLNQSYHINPTPFLNNNPINNNNTNNSQTQSTTSTLSNFPSSTSISSTSTATSIQHNNTNHHHNKLSPPNYAKLRIDCKNNNSENNSNSHSKSSSLSSTTAPAISHATRIPQTNLSYKELLHQHQFTPSGGSSSTSPMKQSFETLDLNAMQQSNNHNNHNTEMSLESQREAFLRKPIIEEPKKSVTGYQLFAKWKKTHKLNNANNKSLSAAWNELSQLQKEEWNKKSEKAKMDYHHEKEIWQKYVQEAKTLVCVKYLCILYIDLFIC